jgi:hypothetical protein
MTNKLMAYCEIKGRVFKITGTAGPDDVYLIRYYVIRSQYFNFFIHQFLRSDRDDLHDHPWDFCTYLVSGAYNENRYNPETNKVDCIRRVNYRDNDGFIGEKANIFVFRKATDQHQVVVDHDLKEKDKHFAATTLFFSGPTKREWGFIRSYNGVYANGEEVRPPTRKWVKWTTYLGLPEDTKSRG